MRVNPNQASPLPAESSRTGNANAANNQSSSAANGVLGEDQAQFSDLHAQVQMLVGQAVQLPEVRQERINALREVIANGAYNPGSGQIANAVFDHMLQLRAA